MPYSHSREITTRSHRTIFLVVCSVAWLSAWAQQGPTHLALGDSLLKADKPQRALEAFDLAIQIDPTAHAYLGRAKAYFALDRNDRFLLDVERSLRMDSTIADAHYLRSVYAFRAQDMATAARHSGRALELATDEKIRAQSRIIRGLSHAEMRSPSQAITDLELGINAGNEDLEAMRVLARLYDGAGRHQEALFLLERLTVLEPKEVGHWSNRSFELIQLGRNDEALTMIETALAIDKDEPVSLSNRAYIYYTLGRDKEAMNDVEKSLKAYPANAHALRTRALLYLRKGDRDMACDDLTLARVLAHIPEVDTLVKEHCASETEQIKP